MARTLRSGLKRGDRSPFIVRDLYIVAGSIALAVYLVRSDAIGMILASGFAPFEAFVAGFFFTSLLTIAPSGVALAEMMQVASISQVAFWGAAGAVLGDLVLYFFVRDAISEDAIALLRGHWLKKLKALTHTPFLSWAIPVMGALVIALPLPDEIGIAMLGLSKTDLRFLIPVSFAMNFLGIFLLGLAVSAG
jgi:hypothetical protein